MLIIGVLLSTGLFCFAVLPFLTGGRDMQDYCQAQRPGALLAAVRDSAGLKGYRMTGPDNEGRALIHHPRSYGRFLCGLQFAADRLVSAQYYGSD